MKTLIPLLASALLFITSCVKQDPIPQSELVGIWKLNGYSSTNYKMEITSNGFLYWFNYNDIFNRVEEFGIEYDINRNQMKLYCGNSNYSSYTIRIYRDRKDRLSFSIPVSGVDAEGNPITNYDTYYKMN